MSLARADWSRFERRVVPADGADLAVWHVPGAGDRWVLWVHGAATDHTSFDRQVDAFGDHHHLFLDTRGHGGSPLHEGRRVAFGDVVDDLLLVLDGFGVERAVLVGHSWGGNPVQELAFRHPERADGLVMVGAWGQHRPMSEQERKRIRTMTKAYRAIPWKQVAKVNARMCSADPEVRAVIAEQLLRTGREVFLDLGLSAYEEVRAVDRYPVPTPTLLVRGAKDAPKQLAEIYAGVRAANPNAHEVVIPDVGHVPMVDATIAFNAALEDFLTTI